MLSRILGFASRHARIAAAIAVFAAAPSMLLAEEAAAPAAEPMGSAWTFNLGTDFTSHFISYGADVWGGGNHMGPWDDQATNFIYGTATVAINSEFSGFINIWCDHNNNVPSGLGGEIQEIDANVGLTYTVGKLSTTAANGWWNYAGSTEKVADLTFSFNDGDMLGVKGIAFNPTVNFHYRYDGNGSQQTGLAVVPGIKPTYTLMPDGKYPISLAAPISAGIFENGFQGGHGMYGYFAAGLGATVPLNFIPPKYGAWSAGLSFTYYNTNDDAIPGNVSTNFVVTDVNISVSM